MSLPDAHPLDRAVWSALNTGWSDLAQGEGRALRLDPDYGPFAAAADASAESLAALAAFDPGETGLWLAEPGQVPAPPGMVATAFPPLVQMIAEAPQPEAPSFGYVELTDADGPEMLALATLTKPGPFARHTHRYGGFIGVRQDGRLAAMAGTRMRVPGFHEVSGVCTHPDHRGRGYAGGLMQAVMIDMLARGQTPFLHTWASNAGAIRLYETLGFRIRCEVVVTVLKRG